MGNTRSRKSCPLTPRFFIKKRVEENGSQGASEADVIVIRETDSITKHFDIAPETLGKGRFGVTRVATCRRTNRKYACKTIAKNELQTVAEVEMLQQEVAIMQLLRGNENIIEIFDVYEDKDNVHIIMELCTGGELFDSIIEKGIFSEYDAACMLRHILKVIAVCHDHYVVHRDLKPENFLLSHKGPGSILKAIDFGVSQFISENEVLTEVVGSMYYIAPEVFRRRYSFPADIWSAGVVLYILLSGEPPFNGNTTVETIRAILEFPLEFKSQVWSNVSDAAKDCIQCMLERNPDKRPSARAILNHKWLRDSGVAPKEPLDNAILKKMQRFSECNRLKRIALKLIASNLPEKETEGLRLIFEKLDKDNDGWISLEEMKSAMKESGNQMRDIELFQMIRKVDLDRKGAVNYEEFIAANVQVCRLDAEEKIRVAFGILDADHNGYITRDEIVNALKHQNSHSEEEIDSIFAEVDLNGDGRIDYPEFLAMIRARN